MRRRKPDLLFVLMMVLGVFMIITSQGLPDIGTMDVQAKSHSLDYLHLLPGGAIAR